MIWTSVSLYAIDATQLYCHDTFVMIFDTVTVMEFLIMRGAVSYTHLTLPTKA